jgi:hypothetical protein
MFGNFIQSIIMFLPTFECHSTFQYKRPGDDDTIQFQATTVMSEDSSLLNQIVYNTDSLLLTAIYINKKVFDLES